VDATPTTSAPGVAEHVLAIGADGARGGWVAAACYGESPKEGQPRRSEVGLSTSFEALVALRADSAANIAVDIPIGLRDTVGFRPCDLQARELLEHRRTTVFAPPSRPLLDAARYAAAREIVAELRKTDPEAKGLSAQGFALSPKVREVDTWLRAHPAAQDWLYECHPELSFRAMADRVLDDKKTAHGQVDRLRLVLAAFPDALDVIAQTRIPSKDARLEDVLDAYAALNSALRVAAGDHAELGGEADREGLVMRMVI
jgi:predicted RNase H-like nuclease